VASVSARAFVAPRREIGGNPVTIFHSSEPTTSDERTELARTCAWESIVIEDNKSESSADESPPTFHFYMPSGEEVSFCGHAAIGACSFLANKKSIISHDKSFGSSFKLSSVKRVPFLTAADGSRYDAKVTRHRVELAMAAQHSETECNSQSYSLEDFLSEIGLETMDVKSDVKINWPTYLNSSVARSKTLIPIVSSERVNAAIPPENPTKFREMCDSIDSTGIYLYSTFSKNEIEGAKANKKDLAFECRQFPRASGYPEDPATGIAAGSLAASLHKRQIIFNNRGNYDVLQGTAMGQPSKIGVKIGDYTTEEANHSLNVSYSGIIVIDSLSYLNLVGVTK